MKFLPAIASSQSSLDSSPVTEGRLTVVPDTGGIYLDHEGSRTRLGGIPSALPSLPCNGQSEQDTLYVANDLQSPCTGNMHVVSKAPVLTVSGPSTLPQGCTGTYTLHRCRLKSRGAMSTSGFSSWVWTSGAKFISLLGNESVLAFLEDPSDVSSAVLKSSQLTADDMQAFYLGACIFKAGIINKLTWHTPGAPETSITVTASDSMAADSLPLVVDNTPEYISQDSAVEHISTLPESWTMQDNGRVFVWESASTESLSKGHIYKVNTTETASGILMQLTPAAGFPGDFASLANKASGLYTPYDTVEGSSGGTVRAYTRYKNSNNYWLAPYISGGNFTNMWMITNNPSGNTDTAMDYTGASISADKTSLTAADLTSATWSKNFMNSMQSKSFTDVAGGVSADFEDLTPESTVDIPVASTSTLGGIKVGSRLSIDANGVLSADEQSSSYTLPVASTSTLGGVKVNNSTGALKVASDGLLALLVSAPEAMKNGETGIAMNLKANGGLMFQTVTYGDPTKALGMSPKATYNQLSGSSVTITPSVQPYKLTASDAVTLNSSYSFGINDGVVSTGDIAYAEIVIVLGESGSITAGMDLTLVDALTAGKTNYCVVRWDGEKAKLFVWRVE